MCQPPDEEAVGCVNGKTTASLSVAFALPPAGAFGPPDLLDRLDSDAFLLELARVRVRSPKPDRGELNQVLQALNDRGGADGRG